MMFDDPYLLVRAGSFYLCVVATLTLCVWRRPTTRVAAAAALAGVWNLPILLALHLAAARWGWWRFDADGGLFLGMPVDLYLAWAWLWGVLPVLAFPSLSLPVVVLVALVVDLVLMPAAAPVIVLGRSWLVGEAVGLSLGLVPAQLVARWTMSDTNLRGRALLQIVAFSGLLILVLPAAIVEGAGGSWRALVSMPGWRAALIAQILALPAVLGLSAVQEFVTRGGGTPVPFDPPRRLVTTGVYAFVRNPMQLSAMLVLFAFGAVTANIWIAAGGIMVHLYSVGLAGWDEDEDLRRRFGNDWRQYRQHVRRWLPRLRPWHRPDVPPARLFVSAECGMCREVAAWFEAHGARGLAILPAESHPSRALTRITYEPADGSAASRGVDAIARGLEHVHFGWAYVGFLVRLPVVSPAVQLIADASGAEPRRIGQNTGPRLTSDS
jgi:protein-S-isoprenylcysteine O-methyltransferase Ste14